MGRRPSPAEVRLAPGDKTAGLRIVHVEDSERDAELVLRALKRDGIVAQVSVVQTESDFRCALAELRPQIIISDLALPAFNGERALEIARELAPETPFIFVSGTMGEEHAVRVLNEGATDYVLKGNLLRLPAAVTRALAHARERDDRRRAGRALLDSETGLRRAQAVAGLAHVITGPDGALESWSESLPALLGLAPSDMPASARQWLELAHPDDRAALRDLSIEADRQRVRREHEYRLRHRDGGWIDVRHVSEPIDDPDADGGLRWFNTILDITAQKQAAAALSASEARYRATFEQAAVGIVHTSLDGEIGMVNRTFCDMTGHGRAEAIQLHIRDVTHPEDFARSAEGRTKILEGGGRPYQRELRLVRKDGTSLWASVTTSVVRDVAGKPQHFVSVLSDISERKRMEQTLRAAEQRFRTIFENSIEGIFQSTPDGRVIACNPAHARIMGYASPEELVAAVTDVSTQLYVDPADRRRLFERLAEHGMVHGFEAQFRRKDGSAIWCSMSVRAVKSGDGGVAHILGMQQDITARVLAEREVKRFQAAMDVTIDSIYLTDPETMRFLYVNETACRRMGYPREELMQKTPYEIVGKTRAEIEREYAAAISAGERGTSTESRFVRKDGSEGWTELHRRALKVEGKTLIVTLGRDVTERKQAALRLAESEARFRSLSELSSDWFWEQDAELRFTSFSGGAGPVQWGGDQNDQIGKRRWEISGVAPVEGTWDAHRAVLEARQPFRDFEYMRRMGGGEVRYVAASGEPVLGAEGRFLGYRGTARDITARKRAEQELRESEERFRSLSALSTDWFWQTDREHRFVETPARVTALTGMKANAYVGKRRWEVEGLTPVSGSWDEHRGVLERRESYRDLEVVQVRGDGARVYLQVSGEPVFDAAGEFAGYRGTAKDISAGKRIETALREAEQRFRSIFENSAEGLYRVSLHGALIAANSAMARMFGYESPEAIVAAVTDISKVYVDAADRQRIWDGLNAEGVVRAFETRLLRRDGRTLWASVSVRLVKDESGSPSHVEGAIQDVTERKAEQQRIERLSRMHAVLSGINAAIVRTRDRSQLYREACRVAVEAGKFPFAWLGVVDRQAERLEIGACAGHDDGFLDRVRARLSLRRDVPEGEGPGPRAIRERAPVIVNDIEASPLVRYKAEHAARGIRSFAMLPLLVDGEAAGVLALHASEAGFFDADELKLLNELAGDISFALEVIAKEEKLDYLALHDPLTGLANRALLLERLGQSLHAAGQAGDKVALLWLDLERLATVNESLGRRAGDALIRAVADRLSRVAGRANVARITADHFAAVLPAVKGRSQAARATAAMIQACFGEPFLIERTELKVSAKAGIALFPGDGADAEMLMGNAEAALRKAKESGERQVFYTSDLTERTGATLTLENKLRRALENDEFVLHYQPKVDLDQRRIIGLEALIRWQSPELGLVPPIKFIPLMEQTGMILEAGAWALKRAARDHKLWTDQGLKPPRVAVNVSAIQLRQKDFVSSVEQAILEGVAPTGVDLEITESLVMEDIEANIRKLKQARGLGLEIAIDDFGTGYSSLSYLAKLPVQTLKIDRSFIVTMLNEPDTMTLVQTIISLAHSLRLKVVAEGVDSEEQAKMLRLLRCDEMQGYLYSKPLSLEQTSALLVKGKPA